MQVYPPGSDKPLRSDLVLRVVLRTDLTPIPSTVEVDMQSTSEIDAAMVQGSVIRVGPEKTEFLLVKVHDPRDEGIIRIDNQQGRIKVVGILPSCAPIGKRLQRAVIREGSTLGEIYRACGAQVRIESDFVVPQFSAFKGMVPSYGIAQALQEEAGVLCFMGGKIQFRRLDELKTQPPAFKVAPNMAPLLSSDFLEKHVVPFAVSTDMGGSLISGRSESARGAVYRPRADIRILNNISTALIQRRKLPYQFSPFISAGARIDVDGAPNIVITAAHVYDAGDSGASSEMYSLFWLGEVVK